MNARMACKLVAARKAFLAAYKGADKGFLASVSSDMASLVLEAAERAPAKRVWAFVGPRHDFLVHRPALSMFETMMTVRQTGDGWWW